jgi:uncharacterized protein (TIGR02453 family)
MPDTPWFTPATFTFLTELAANNDRDWFQANRNRYEKDLRDPAVRFITDFAPRLAKISEHFRADPRPVGGSMFRIYRDTRFSKDKSPYKTYTGIQFRHDAGKDAHAPGFYFHIQPGHCFLATGIWHPDSPAARKIREAIVENPKAWKSAIGGKAFREKLELSGDSLKRPPQGIAADHPLIDDLKRKDFIAVAQLDDDAVTSPALLDAVDERCRAGAPLVRFLCGALDVAY